MSNPNWTLRRTTSPSGLVVSLDEAKAHLRVSGSSQNDLIQMLIEASTEKFERDVERCILSASWEQAMDCFPADAGHVLLNMSKATAITSVSYLDGDGVNTVLDPAQYELSLGRNAMVCLNDDDGWPETLDTMSGRDVVFVTFSCGGIDANCVPRIFKQAILLEVARAYFDPAQENQLTTDNGKSYERIVQQYLRSSYP